MRGRRRWLVAVLAAVALVATGCGSDDDGGDGGDAAADVDPDGVLKLGLDLTAGSLVLDPAKITILGTQYQELIYGTLLTMSEQGEVRPGLAEEATILDPSTIRIELRPDLVFSDGAPLDAAAVKFSLERNLTSAKSGGLEVEFFQVASITVDSETTLTVRLKTPVAGAWFRLLRYVETSPVSPKAVQAGIDLDTTPVGAGPFTFVSYTPGQSMVLKRNPTSVDADDVRLAGVEYVHVTAQSLVNALRTGVIDYGGSLPPAQVKELGGASGLSSEIIPSDDTMLWGVMCKNRPPFDDLRVRQALNLAMDRDALNDVVYEGLGAPMWGFFGPESPFYDESLDGFFARDVAEAKSLLAAAGVPNLSFESFYFPGTIGQTALEILQQQWAEAGIKVTLKPLTSAGDFFPNATGAPMVFFALDVSGLSKVTRLLVEGSVGNVCNWNDQTLVSLVRQMQGVEETSPAGVEIWKKIQRQIFETAAMVYGLFGTQGRVLAERVGDAVFYPGRNAPTLDIANAYIEK
ncbi:MAG: ABC transporter substrate-binding protein [Acidimicrobiia bacterium]